ncbi:MAG: peptidase [Lachnospiraceae bacterium]
MGQDTERIYAGARIVITKWIRLKPWENLLIVTCDEHIGEAQILKTCAARYGARADLMIVEKKGIHVGIFFDRNPNVFDGYKAIIGAAAYSIVTTRAAKRAIKRGCKFLSLPLITNDNRSLLEYPFLRMDTRKSKMMSQVIMKYLNSSAVIRVKTPAGTDLCFSKRNRTAGFFNGSVRDGKRYSSASFEVYVPIEESETEGTMMIDGSLGYIGGLRETVQLEFHKGKISSIQKNDDGLRLQQYLDSYCDANMYVASELGIGLNSYAKCQGNSYIEDESAYGTFHIGFGRNIALGGVHEAKGHFDVVGRDPDIYVDNRMIMQKGRIIIPEMQVY